MILKLYTSISNNRLYVSYAHEMIYGLNLLNQDIRFFDLLIEKKHPLKTKLLVISNFKIR